MNPTQFGNFTLLERISHGGMAEVFRAKTFGEAGFERVVALKLLLPSIASDDEFVTMLIDEAKIAGQLHHANIAEIFDLGIAEGRHYIVQEYVEGRNLRTILEERKHLHQPLDTATAAMIGLKISEGLAYAHEKRDAYGRPLNLVHRDISPQNILISVGGAVKIVDFGIAKAEGRATQTVAGLVKGKFAYMSPEQLRGLPVDKRADVFATGILLHEMLTNRPLFLRGTEFETLKQARDGEIPPPSHINPLVPPKLDKVILKALARHLDDRYQSAAELRDALWPFAHQHGANGQSIDLAQLAYPASPQERAASQPPRGAANEYGVVEEDPDIEPTDGEATRVDPNFGIENYDDLLSDTDLDDPAHDERTLDDGLPDLDDDAAWAANLGGASHTPSPYSLPARPDPGSTTPMSAARGGEETTSERSTTVGQNAHNAPTRRGEEANDDPFTTATAPAAPGMEALLRMEQTAPSTRAPSPHLVRRADTTKSPSIGGYEPLPEPPRGPAPKNKAPAPSLHASTMLGMELPKPLSDKERLAKLGPKAFTPTAVAAPPRKSPEDMTPTAPSPSRPDAKASRMPGTIRATDFVKPKASKPDPRLKMTPTALSALPASEVPLGREPIPSPAPQVSQRPTSQAQPPQRPSSQPQVSPPLGMSAEEAAEEELRMMRSRREDSQPAAMLLPKSRNPQGPSSSGSGSSLPGQPGAPRGGTEIPQRGEESVMLEMPVPTRRTPTAMKVAEAAVADAIRSGREKKAAEKSASDSINLASYADVPAARAIVFDPQKASPQTAPSFPAAVPGPSQAAPANNLVRVYLVSAAVFLLLLAGAATLTIKLTS